MKKVLAVAVGLAVLAFCSWAAASPGCCSKAKATTASASAACEKVEKASAAACETKTEQTGTTSVKVLKLSVAGMHCGSCSKTVQTALSKLDGVQAAKVSYTRKSAEVKYNPATVNDESIIQTVNATGFTATVKSAKAKLSSDACCKAGTKAEAASTHEDCCKLKKVAKAGESDT